MANLTSTTTPAYFDPNTWYSIQSKINRPTYLSVGPDIGNGTRVAPFGGAGTLWQLSNATTGSFFSIRPKGYDHLCLSIPLDGELVRAAHGAPVLPPCNSSSADEWVISNTVFSNGTTTSEGITLLDSHTGNYLIADPYIADDPTWSLWQVNAAGSINDAAYSSIPTTSVTATPTASTISTPTPTGNSASGFRKKVGSAFAMTSSVCVAAFLLGAWIML